MSDYERGFEDGLAEGLGIREALTAPETPPELRLPAPDSTSTQMVPSVLLGSCGHPLDPWETHLEHRAGCERELCLDDRCDCPETCPDCCVACGYDLAERMGS